MPLPNGFQGYLGDQNGVLFKAHHKLGKQDPWLLTAEESLALLRTLTDDIFARHASIGEDMVACKEEMIELKRAKQAADAKLRKVCLAFERPKKPAKKATADDKDGDSKDKSKNAPANADENDEGQNGIEKKKEPFKPTATKKQFKAAKKAQQKASDPYEKGTRKLVARMEPIGYACNFSAS